MATVKGEVRFDTEAGAYALHFGINSLCALEQKLDMPVAEIGRELTGAGLRLSTLRTVFWSGLQDAHETLTERDAGKLMDELGAQRAGELVVEAFAAAFPQEDANAPAGPRGTKKASAGSGQRSS